MRVVESPCAARLAAKEQEDLALSVALTPQNRDATREVGVTTPSQRFDRQLFTRKCSELSHQMQEKSAALRRKIGKNGGSILVNIVVGELALLREWVVGVDQAAREVWGIKGKPSRLSLSATS